MASVDWKKIQGSGAGLIGHATRHDGKDVDYSNKQIDPARSKDNYTVGGWKTSTYSIEHFFSSRVKELDAIHKPKRIRKDRVTKMGFCLTAPEGLTPAQERLFYKIAYEEIAKTCGGRRNLTPGFVHMDEIHRYYDKMTGDYKTSRSHMHVFGIPWTDSHGVNAKNFVTRERMRDLNKRIDERCMEVFHVHFLKGDKGLHGRDVADLKRESIQYELQKGEERLFELSIREQELSMALQEQKVLKRDLEAQRDALKAEVDKLSQELDKSPQRALKRAYKFMDKFQYDDERSLLDKFLQEERKRSRGLEH